MNPNEQELPSVFSLIRARKKVVFAVASCFLAAGIAYTVFAPPVWQADATIVFPVHTPSLLGVGNFDQTSLAATLTGGPTPLKVFSGMLESQRALEYVASNAGLTKLQVKTMRNLQDQSMESSITISAHDRSPDLAKKVVALHLQALEQINEAVNKPLVGNDADVLKSKLDAQQKKVTSAEQALLDFQNRAVTAPAVMGMGSGKDASVVPTGGQWGSMLKQLEIDYDRVDSGVQAEASRTHWIAKQGGSLPADVEPAKKWRDKLTDLQYQLQIQQLTLSPDSPELVNLKKSINITQSELRGELQKYATATSQGMVDPAGGSKDGSGSPLPDLLTQRIMLEAQIRAVRRLAKLAPSEGIEMTRLVREVATQSGILQQLQAQYEWAELQTDRDPNHWEVMDPPEVEDKPINKSFSKNGALALIAGLGLGCLFALYSPGGKKAKTESAPEEMDERKAA